jgi:hypothetical protein
MKNLFFDIETIPDQSPNALDTHLEAVKPPAQYKKPESIDKWMKLNAEEVAVENWKRTALNGLYGEIVSIAWAFDDNETNGLVRSPEESESNLIESFFAEVVHECEYGVGKFPRIQWTGHNVLEFDLAFLWKRCVVLGIRPPVRLPKDSRHGKDDVFDTMRAWAGFKGYVKQADLVKQMNIDIPGYSDESKEVDGSVVWDLVKAGLLDTVLEYNKLDVEYVRELWRRMTWDR